VAVNDRSGTKKLGRKIELNSFFSKRVQFEILKKALLDAIDQKDARITTSQQLLAFLGH
jgi:hypothetical protein